MLHLAQNFLKDKVIATRKDQVAFCFYNTRVVENQNSFRGIYVLGALDEPDAPLIKKLEKLSDPAGTTSFPSPFALRPAPAQAQAAGSVWHSVAFEKQIGSGDAKSGKSEFYQALWTCSAMFGERYAPLPRPLVRPAILPLISCCWRAVS